MDEKAELTEDELLNCKNDFNSSMESIDVTVNEEESTMTDQAIHYLLDEILKKKKDLHDPRHRCNKFFSQIRKRLIVQYGLCFSVRTLERKYHYLKRAFDGYCKNKKICNVKYREPMYWPFFSKLMEIFAEELEIGDAPTMASLYPPIPLPKSALPITLNTKKGKHVYSNSNVENKKKAVKVEIKETIWNHAITLDFINECVQRKNAIWDPNYRRRDILLEIQAEMKAKGYTFQLETLNIKLRNLRSCYNKLMETRRNKNMTDSCPERWPYFALLHEIYNGFIEQNIPRKKSGRKPSLIIPKSSRRPRSKFANTGRKHRTKKPKLEPDAEQELDGDCNNIGQDNESGSDENFDKISNNNSYTSGNNIYGDIQFTQKILAFEERRTIVTEQILEVIRDSNHIRQRKLEFNQNKLSYLKAKAKIKQFF